MIYFAQADGTDLVKIGFTTGKAAKRLADLQTGCPHKLVLLAAIEGDEQDEAGWHTDFAADRVSGEWFKMSWRLCLAIARAESGTRSAAAPAAPDEPPAPTVAPPKPSFYAWCLTNEPALYSVVAVSTLQRGWALSPAARQLPLFAFRFSDRYEAAARECLGGTNLHRICTAIQSHFGLAPGQYRVRIETDSAVWLHEDDHLPSGEPLLFEDL